MLWTAPAPARERHGCRCCSGDLGKFAGPIEAAAREQPHALALAPGQQPQAIVLDLVNPTVTRRWAGYLGRRTGGDKADRARPGTQPHIGALIDRPSKHSRASIACDVSRRCGSLVVGRVPHEVPPNMHWNGEPYTVELFDNRGNLIHVISRHCTLDDAHRAHATALRVEF